MVHGGERDPPRPAEVAGVGADDSGQVGQPTPAAQPAVPCREPAAGPGSTWNGRGTARHVAPCATRLSVALGTSHPMRQRLEREALSSRPLTDRRPPRRDARVVGDHPVQADPATLRGVLEGGPMDVSRTRRSARWARLGAVATTAAPCRTSKLTGPERTSTARGRRAPMSSCCALGEMAREGVVDLGRGRTQVHVVPQQAEGGRARLGRAAHCRSMALALELR